MNLPARPVREVVRYPHWLRRKLSQRETGAFWSHTGQAGKCGVCLPRCCEEGAGGGGGQEEQCPGSAPCRPQKGTWFCPQWIRKPAEGVDRGVTLQNRAEFAGGVGAAV